jgi:tetratricopeptide (TPR) repeat protein
MKMRLGAWILVGAVLMFVTPAHADDSADAKTHYQKATAHYAVGEYHDAAMEYEAAYKAKQDPALLYNAAQSHRLAGDNPKALLLYRNIVKLYPTSKYAGESKDRIVKLEQAIATTTSPPNQPATVETPGATPVQPVQPILPPVATAASAPAAPVPAAPPPSAAIATTTAPDSGGDTPIYKKWWFWGGAGVVVVAAIVIVAASSGSTTAWANVPNVNGKVR